MRTRSIKKIPEDVLQRIQLKLDEMIDLLKPYLVVLTSEERQALTKIEEETYRFLEMSHGLAVDYPDLFPSFMKAAVFGENFSTVTELSGFANKLNNFRDSISDTEMLAGNHAMEFALAFYHTVKMAARRDIPGAKVIFEELKPRFLSRKLKRRKAAPGDGRQLELFGS